MYSAGCGRVCQGVTGCFRVCQEVSKIARNLVGCFLSEIVIVQGKMYTRGKSKKANYMLYHKSNIPIAIIKKKKS